MTGAGAQAWVAAADGTRLSVREWGDPAGPPLLLVHGQAQCHLCFAPQLADAALQACRIVAFDMRGHGESGKPPGEAPYREAARFGDDVARVIAATGLRRPVAVGWSMGGRALREYLLLHGGDGLAGINFVGSRVIEGPFRPPEDFSRLAEADLRTKIATTARFLRACYHRQPDAEGFAHALAYNMLLPFEARAGIGAWVSDPEAATRALQSLRIPVLVTHGRQDQVIPLSASRAVAEAAPQGRLSLYEDCGHSPFQEQPERFNRELAEFVREAGPGFSAPR